MTGTPPAEAELILDVRELASPPRRPEEFLALWNLVEPALAGRDLRAKRVHQLDGPDGTVRLEVARLAGGVSVVSAATRFSIVAVREPSRLRYRCKDCADEGKARYGPFICAAPSAGDGAEHRVCDKHVSILDGALTATCQEHRPACHECGRSATFRCAGPACRQTKARPTKPWCDQHRRPHPQDPDLDYCPSCYGQRFPPCEKAGCANIGTARCEHVLPSLERCPRRMCARHGRRWQVFGGERLGLARCSQHEMVTGLPPGQLLFQIVTGATARRHRERLPSLRGFAHTFRNTGRPELALDYRRIRQMIADLAATVNRTGPRPAAEAMGEMRQRWDDQLAEICAAKEIGEQLVAELRRIVQAEIPRHGATIAAALTLADYNPAATRGGQVTRPAKLFVNVPEELRGLFLGKGRVHQRRYTELLTVEVEIEGGKRRR